MKLFISYTSDDRAFVTRLYGALNLISESFRKEDSAQDTAKAKSEEVPHFNGHICLELDREGCSDGQSSTIQLTVKNMCNIQIDPDVASHLNSHISLTFDEERRNDNLDEITQQVTTSHLCRLRVDIVPYDCIKYVKDTDTDEDFTLEPGVKVFGAFINYLLERVHLSREELANHLCTQVDLVDALIEGELPESEIDDDLIWDLSDAFDQHPNVLRIALGRKIEEPYNQLDEEIDRVLCQRMGKHW